MTPRVLTPAEFQDALQKGLGRALKCVLDGGKLIDDAALLDASIHSRAYDPQVEGSRAPWIMEILDAATAAEAFRPRILVGLQDATDTWDLQQLCGLAGIYAQRGCAEARAALYDLYERWPDRTAGWLGVEEILTLDGMSGFLWAAAQRLPHSSEHDWWCDFDELIDQADERFGVEEVDKAVEQSPQLDAFRQVLRAQRDRRSPPETRPTKSARAEVFQAISAKEIMEEIETSDPERLSARYAFWGRHAAEEDLHQILTALLSQSHPRRLANYLQIFRRRALPRFDERLVALAEHPNDEVRENALAALAMNAHEAVRELALARLRDGFCDGETLNLLARNYSQGDHTLIQAVLRRSGDQDEMHELVWVLCDIFIDHETPDGMEALLFSYEETPCSQCRERIVAHLLRLGLVPDEMREECRYDANESIRQRVEAAA